MATAKPLALTQFRTVLQDLYGDRIERVVLYGSRARADARPDSDYEMGPNADIPLERSAAGILGEGV